MYLDYNWDAQLAARSRIEPEPLEKQYLTSIIDNMYIPGGTKLPEIHTRHDNKFIDITSIIVKRRSSYEATVCPDFALQMTEVIDLHVEKSKYNGLYRAVATEENFVKHNRRWYEASIISTAAQSILTENVHLEVGEYAKWTTERLAGAGFIQDLIDLTSALIAKSDAVGCPTDGFLPEPDPERKAAAAEARNMHGYTGALAQSHSGSAPRRPPIVGGPPGLVHAVQRVAQSEEAEDILTPMNPAQEEGVQLEEMWGFEKPPGFW